MSIDRDALLAALEAMGGEDDAMALEAARSAHAMVDQAGLEWEEILLERLPGTVAEPGPVIEVDEDDESVLQVIDTMLARPALHDGTRDDLQEFRADLEKGELDPEDRAYVIALYQRVQD